jgi:hypothetical protein
MTVVFGHGLGIIGTLIMFRAGIIIESIVVLDLVFIPIYGLLEQNH